MKKAVTKFLFSRTTQKGHLLFVFVMAWIARFCMICVPFKYYRPWIGKYQKICDYCPLVTQEQLFMAIRCGRFIERICEKLPWKAKCLVQAMIMSLYARYYKFPYVIHLGMAKRTDANKALAEPMLAHAWTRVGPVIVTGDGGLEDFVIVGSFSYYA